MFPRIILYSSFFIFLIIKITHKINFQRYNCSEEKKREELIKKKKKIITIYHLEWRSKRKKTKYRREAIKRILPARGARRD